MDVCKAFGRPFAGDLHDPLRPHRAVEFLQFASLRQALVLVELKCLIDGHGGQGVGQDTGVNDRLGGAVGADGVRGMCGITEENDSSTDP